ncbi:uncharacterized protein BJX67DRAFT_361369 [Aspergillus lucknowensis]|uniref:Transcription factor domain-containing protein n=1 Tax=Aspergillus lucknowensis TaxID=176173 RepID=A0ABR4LJ11_9EURO
MPLPMRTFSALETDSNSKSRSQRSTNSDSGSIGSFWSQNGKHHQASLSICSCVLLPNRRSTFCMQHELPITLRTIDDLPVPGGDGDSVPALLTGFCNLVRLFTRIDGPLIQAPYLSLPHPTYSKARIRDIQEALQTGATKDPIIDEVQRVDIWTTLAWLSSLLWQYSASHFMLTSEPSNTFFAPSYPFIIARNFLSLICGASLDSVRPHGYGMEIKLFQLANSLIDVLVYVPSLTKPYDGFAWGPRHAVVALEHLLNLVAGGKSERLDRLHARMAQLDFTPTLGKALPEVEGDESSSGSEGPSAVHEISRPDKVDGGSADYRTGYQWNGEEIQEHLLHTTEEVADLSDLFPELDIGTVHFLSGNGEGLSGRGEEPDGMSTDFLALGAHVSHSAGYSAAFAGV